MTFEILDRSEVKDGKELRIVPAAELHAAELIEQAETDNNSTPSTEVEGTSTPLQLASKSNVNTHDDPTNQKLTMTEIEALKQNATGSGKDLIEKIMQSHSTLDQKTTFSLAKYTLRKHKKYMKRFTVLPLDVTTLLDWMFAVRDYGKIMEMRNEAVGLVGCWANVHAAGEDSAMIEHSDPSSRYLMVDDTGGLVVAAMAERMGILHQTNLEECMIAGTDETLNEHDDKSQTPAQSRKANERQYRPSAMSSPSNSITLVHANQQPNLGLLRYFNFDSNDPSPSHPLYTNLKTLSWLQLLEPDSDITYQEPQAIPNDELSKMKSNQRSAYFRKRRRWERVMTVVDETRAGGFNGLIVASFTDPTSILRHLVPLLSGGSHVVVYSPTIEPLARVADYYSTARRTAFINTPPGERSQKDFPVDPTLLLAPMVQTARVRKWQVLPGRTHPLMTGRGGPEGYIFVGTRVIPAEGKVDARGRPARGKKVKVEGDNEKVANMELAAGDVEDKEVVGSPLKKMKVEVTEEREAARSPSTALLDIATQADEADIAKPVLGPASEALEGEQDQDHEIETKMET